MRVVTLNLWGMRGDWATRRELIVAGLRELRPDLVAFQEAITTDEYDQAADLLGGGFHLAHSREREADGQGITIASRWPLDGVRELDLNATPRTTDFACTTLIATVRVPDPLGPLVFVNHFPDYQLDHEHEREQQAVIAARAIEELVARRGEHVILVGDLDAEPDAASVRFLAGRQSLGGQGVCHRDARESAHPGEPGDTFTPRNPLMAAANWDWPFRQIDHILVRCGAHGGPTLAIAACDRIFDGPRAGVWASDHFGLVADLDLPPERPAATA